MRKATARYKWVRAVAIGAVAVALACNSEKSGEGSGNSAGDSLITLAQKFKAELKAGRYEEARAMMSDNPRRWYNAREGEGREWNLGPKTGSWAMWDEEFKSQSEPVGWREEPGQAILTNRETNDYFRLLERGWVTNEIVYYFDAAGKIEGLLIRAIGARPPGRTEEFMAWAQANSPDEIKYLMPDGEVDPSGDRPGRYRALLNRWRASAGLSTIE